jgi:copper(I)-binding protein
MSRGALAADITVTEARIPMAPPGVASLAGYCHITNHGAAPVRLVSARSPAFQSVMLHETTNEGGVMRMRHAHEVPIPPHATVAFEPGGLHMMLEGPARALRVGDEVSITLGFADGTAAEVTFTVVAP